MIVALDTNCILPGRVGGIESHVMGIVEALLGQAAWLRRLVLVTRPENDELFRAFEGKRCTAVLQERPVFQGERITNWASLLTAHPEQGRRLLAEFQQDKLALLRRARADVVHFPGSALNPLEIDLPTVLTLHDLQHRRFPQYFSEAERSNRERYWAESARRADAVLTGSEFASDDIARQFEVCPEKMFVAIPAVREIFHHRPAAAALAALRRRLELAERFFIYPAAAYPHKNHRRLLRAFAAAGLGTVQLVLTGGGQETSALPQLIDELGLQGRVRLMGRVTEEELTGLYALATGMVFASEYEGCGLPLIEAMATGCPVAAAGVTSIPEIVGEAALLFDPGSEAQMTAALRTLANYSAGRARLSRQGTERAGLFTTARFARELHAAYNHAVTARLQRAA
jgi:glycosyltransferase involved in cell wall biosynthesis